MTSSDTVPAKRSLLERLVAVSALATSFALALSFTYDWGFFSALGISFASAPTSISDHLRTGLLWASRLVPAVLLTLVLDLLTRRIDHGLTEEEIVEASPDPERARKKNELATQGSSVWLSSYPHCVAHHRFWSDSMVACHDLLDVVHHVGDEAPPCNGSALADVLAICVCQRDTISGEAVPSVVEGC